MNYLTQYYKNLAEQLKYKLENLTVQLNEEIKLKDDKNHPRNIHNEIGSHILNLHVNEFPHIKKGDDQKLSLRDSFRDFEMKFDSHPDAPFTDPTKALEAMSPYIMQGNRDFEEHVRETLDTPGGRATPIDDLVYDHIGDFGAHIENLMKKSENSTPINPGSMRTGPQSWQAFDPRN
jgi:hypothetical protein